MNIKISKSKRINDIKTLTFNKFIDNRGFFSRIYCKKEFKNLNFKLKQINFSKNKKKGTIRGLHFLKESAKESKIVICLNGKIFDVIIDMRPNSKTYLTYLTLKLDNKKGVLIPPGFAHGFQTLSNYTDVLYFHSEFYTKKFDGGINPFDTNLSIKWPIKNYIISKKDLYLPQIKKNEM
mgnify:CR=1 FL=1|jgi:dTDP-4-dehydrorhamnose 3,5-epimerase